MQCRYWISKGIETHKGNELTIVEVQGQGDGLDWRGSSRDAEEWMGSFSWPQHSAEQVL